jgi:hypothetical protein
MPMDKAKTGVAMPPYWVIVRTRGTGLPIARQLAARKGLPAASRPMFHVINGTGGAPANETLTKQLKGLGS